MIDQEQYPISLKEIEHILERVYDRYPLLNKYDITLIIKSFFETTRSLLLNGDILSINGFIANFQLISYSKMINNKVFKVIKAKLSTPGFMKNV